MAWTTPRLALRILIIALVAVMAVSIVSADARMASADDASETAEQSTEPSPAAASEPEIEWITDEDGKRYYIYEVPKGVEGRDWMWLSEGDRVQLRYGLQYDVVDHDDLAFRVKIFERPNTAKAMPTAEELEQKRLEAEQRTKEIEESYRADLETADQLIFEEFDNGLPRVGQWRNGFDIADMNNDGHPDIVFGPARKSFPTRPNIFLGDGEGNWRRWREARYPRLPYDYGDAAAADFNGDGHLDLAFGIHLRGLLVLVGDGKGVFRAWSKGIGLEIPGQGGDASTFSSRAIETVDWDGDGRVDLMALGEGPKGIPGVDTGDSELKTANGPIVFLNQANGTWRSKGYPSKIFGDHLALGDFNGDQRLDFVTASNSPNRRILNIGGASANWETGALWEARPGSFLRSVAAGRLDGDGRDDLVVGYVGRENDVWRTGVDVFYSEKNLAWRRETLFSTEGRSGIYGLATGDLNADGKLDIAFSTGAGEVLVFVAEAEEDGFFRRELAPEMPDGAAGCRGYGLRLEDLDGDDRADLIVSFAGERGGIPGIGFEPGCAQGGSLRVWASRPPAAEDAATAR